MTPAAVSVAGAVLDVRACRVSVRRRTSALAAYPVTAETHRARIAELNHAEWTLRRRVVRAYTIGVPVAVLTVAGELTPDTIHRWVEEDAS